MALTLQKYPPEPTDLVDLQKKCTRPWLMFFQSLIDQIIAIGTSGVTGPGSSVDSQIALFNGTTGGLLKAATGSGFVQATSGVYSVFTLAQGRLLGRGGASGTGTPEALTPGASLSLAATTLDAVFLRNPTLTAPSSPADGDAWVEASGTTPARVVKLMVRDGGASIALAQVTY